jgi:hypothetical protein
VYETAIAPIASVIQTIGLLSKFRILERLFSEAARTAAAENSELRNGLNTRR